MYGQSRSEIAPTGTSLCTRCIHIISQSRSLSTPGASSQRSMKGGWRLAVPMSSHAVFVRAGQWCGPTQAATALVCVTAPVACEYCGRRAESPDRRALTCRLDAMAECALQWAPAGAVRARRARPCSRHNSEPGQLAGTLHNPVAQPSEWPTGHASVDPESTHYPRPALRSVWLPSSRGVWMTVTAAGPQGGLAGRLGGAPAPAPRRTRATCGRV